MHAGELERKTETNLGTGAFWRECQRTVKNSTALGDKQQPRMLWEWRKREGRKEETQQHGGWGGLGCHVCLQSSFKTYDEHMHTKVTDRMQTHRGEKHTKTEVLAGS